MESRQTRVPAKIQDRMNRLGIKSVRELARRADLKHSTCVQTVTGRSEPLMSTCIKLCRALDMSREYLDEILIESYGWGTSLTCAQVSTLTSSNAINLSINCVVNAA